MMSEHTLTCTSLTGEMPKWLVKRDLIYPLTLILQLS
jgi:hypothetical protein